jgi:hypothetical protein
MAMVAIKREAVGMEASHGCLRVLRILVRQSQRYITTRYCNRGGAARFSQMFETGTTQARTKVFSMLQRHARVWASGVWPKGDLLESMSLRSTHRSRRASTGVPIDFSETWSKRMTRIPGRIRRSGSRRALKHAIPRHGLISRPRTKPLQLRRGLQLGRGLPTLSPVDGV